MISRTAEYALRAVLYLGGLPGGATASAADAATATAVPERYLARVLNTLAHARLLRSTRGAHGGFRLAREPGTLTLAEVIAPFDAVGELPRCLLRDQPCGVGHPCLAHSDWHDVAQGVHGFFRRTTIADLLKNRADLAAAQAITTLPIEKTG
jgi:Rrf2 family protein